ncbi:MAG: septation protein SepH [Mycobacteriaceae bacterium]
MRALQVVGLDADGTHVICADTEGQQTFRLPADEQLRAAARGDLTRLGQIEIEIEAQLRPKEIQARIRAGATVEQVAAAAGLSAQKVERYAYPVLLERSRAAEIAQGAHPVLTDGPAVITLLQAVTATLTARGQDLTDATWDAWRGEDGRWVVQLRWRAGRSDNRAHWRFSPGAHGGTAASLDDHASELVDPAAVRPLRTIAPLATLAQPTLDDTVQDTTAENTTVQDTTAAPAAPVPAETSAPNAEPPVETAAPVTAGASKTHRGRPSMPSWEDVLLGVRSQRG